METREVCFICSFAPRSFLRDWKLACQCLGQTVASILNSQNPSVVIVIAGNESPMGEIPHDSRVHFVSVGKSREYPLKGVERRHAIVRDKATKTECAWNYAKKLHSFRYVMKVDADDFVSDRLVGFVAEAEPVPGYVITDGWMWNSGNRLIIESCEHFDRMCGTSVILRGDLADLPGSTRDIDSGFAPNAPEVIRDFGSLVLLTENHPNARSLMSLRGFEMHPVPFRAAVYRVGNANSITQRGMAIHSLRFLIGRLRRCRLITPSLRREFLLPRT
jgi:hypothetical protein